MDRLYPVECLDVILEAHNIGSPGGVPNTIRRVTNLGFKPVYEVVAWSRS